MRNWLSVVSLVLSVPALLLLLYVDINLYDSFVLTMKQQGDFSPKINLRLSGFRLATFMMGSTAIVLSISAIRFKNKLSWVSLLSALLVVLISVFPIWILGLMLI